MHYDVHAYGVFQPVFDDGEELDFCDFLADRGRFSLMQFTGLFDKEGEEIYEGDRWGSVDGLDLEATVIFYEGCWTLRWDNGASGDLHAHVVTKSGRVIGNIYEHPNLLKQ